MKRFNWIPSMTTLICVFFLMGGAFSSHAGDEIYQVFVGGGYGSNRTLGRHIAKNLPATELNQAIERLLRVFLERRHENECFRDFANRHELHTLAAALNGEVSQNDSNSIHEPSMAPNSQQRFVTAND